MKNLFLALFTLAFLISCKEKKNEPQIAVDSLTLPASLELKVGEKKTLILDISPVTATDKSIQWTSNNEGVATVSQNGEVIALKNGTATISAASKANNSKTASCIVSVQSSFASIALGEEKFILKTLLDDETTTLNNAPRTLLATLNNLPVYITAEAEATIKEGTQSFQQGQKVDFRTPKTFSVTLKSGKTVTYTINITPYNKDSNPYGVYTPLHLSDVRNDDRGSYKMMNNITLPAANSEGITITGIADYDTKGWLPIANSSVKSTVYLKESFDGIFDGGNFVIDNLFTRRSDMNTTGLFGAANKAVLKNLGVKGAADAVHAPNLTHVGLLVGVAKNCTITNCFTSGDITSSSKDFTSAGGLAGFISGSSGSITRCYATGNVIISSESKAEVIVGGLVGTARHSYSTAPQDKSSTFISTCYATGNVSSSGSEVRAGGLLGEIGSNSVTMSHCYATGEVTATSKERGTYSSARAGGLLGECWSEKENPVKNCYATGNVSASCSNASRTFAGGFGGQLGKPGKFSRCFYKSEAEIKINNNVVSELSDKGIDGITAKPKKEMQESAFVEHLNEGNSVWERDNSKNDGLPYLKGM